MIDRLIVNVLEWAAGHTDEGRYSPVAIVFHWTMAALVVFSCSGAGGWAGCLWAATRWRRTTCTFWSGS